MRFGNIRYWVAQVLGWAGFAIFYTLIGYFFNNIDRLYYKRIGVFILIGIAITHLMRICVIELGLLQKKLTRQILVFLTLTFVCGMIASFCYIRVIMSTDMLRTIDREVLYEKDYSFWYATWLLVLNSSLLYLFLFFIWNLIYFVYHYVEKSRKQQLDTLHLEALVRELELKTIKAHINPHFIFNSLNSIRALVDENPQRARAAITELSNILRNSMQAEKLQTVTFEKELGIVKDYLALENMRFEDRLRIEYQIDEDTLDQPVPPMMLQTLVENAIKHGISKQINGGIVRIVSDFKGNFHELLVQNTGHLNGGANHEGFGLSSTNDRLNLLYGDKAKFQIKQLTPSLVEAKVLIPFDNH
ncbi:MAG TPA: histidine kinase [Chitinophagaceae bacterium]|jgi:two-component sensor histidine kinase|nr:histidine kinase [Chitinophagaceae bacterium]